MECDGYPENGATANVRCRGVKRRLCGLRLPIPSRTPRRVPELAAAASAGAAASRPLTSTPAPTHAQASHAGDNPFMNEMDEITYWIYTKRAPCLMSYDEVAKKRAQHKPPPPPPVHSISDDTNSPTAPLKKKRKLSLLDDDSDSGKGHENVFFDSSQRPLNQQTIISSGKTSDIDFNIKKSSIQEKTRCRKKNNNTTLHKKNKIVSSTPKGTAAVRRSLRNSRKSFNESRALNSSYELINVSLVNGSKSKAPPTECEQNRVVEKKPTDNIASCVQKSDVNIDSAMCIEEVRTNINNANGKYEDLSDVSGFTANYIRSTKIHATKNGNKSKKCNKSLLKESQPSEQKDLSKTLMCVNKSANTGLQNTMLNCSSDSSQNLLNLVTIQKNGPAKMSRSTSLLKFMDSKQLKNRGSQLPYLDTTGESSKLDTSPSPRNNTQRYPRRCRTSMQHAVPGLQETVTQTQSQAQSGRRGNQKGHKDGPSTPMTRARSGRIRTPVHPQPLLVLSASSEQVSSAVTMNVASPVVTARTRKQKTFRKSHNKLESTIKSKRRKKSMNKSEHSGGRDSLRDKSGFAACFSDSEGDDTPLKAHKFFCS